MLYLIHMFIDARIGKLNKLFPYMTKMMPVSLEQPKSRRGMDFAGVFD